MTATDSLQARATAWSLGEGHQPLLEVIGILTQPSIRVELIRFLKHGWVTVDKVTAHFDNGLENVVSNMIQITRLLSRDD